jgi:hypothetical protein
VPAAAGFAVSSIDWNSDGSRIALSINSGDFAFGTGLIQVFNTDSGELLWTVRGENQSLEAAWNPNGTLLAGTIISGDGTSDPRNEVRLWNSGTAELVMTLTTAQSPTSLAWSPDGSQLAVGEFYQGSITIWDTQTESLLATLDGPTTVSALDWNADGSQLASVFDSGSVWVWDIETAANLIIIDTEDASIVDWNPSDSLMATAGSNSVELWNPATGERLISLAGRGAVAWSPDGTRIATSTLDNRISIIDVSNLSIPVSITDNDATQVPGDISSPTPTFCPDAPSPRLTVGQQARVVPSWASNLRAEPALDAERVLIIPGRGVFTVLDGPLCEADYVWWQVEYDGQRGWTAEGREGEYWLEPLPESEANTECPGAPVQRLRVGAQARQALDQDPLLVLETPTSSNTLFQIYPGDILDVIGGPLCFPVDGNNTSWWQVRNSDGLTGWVAEGRLDRYYLELYPLGE